jgi:hypothetical protein
MGIAAHFRPGAYEKEAPGSSTAGEVWRSMLADHLASEIGKTVELGTTRRKVAVIDSGSREGTLNRHLSSSDAPLHNSV